MTYNLELDAGWQESVISVRDLRTWVSALIDLFRWDVIQSDQVDRQLLTQWHLDESVSAEEVVLACAEESKRLVRLVQFNGVIQTQMRSSGMAWDTGGIHSLLCYARDTDATFRLAQDLGWSALHDPVNMEFGGRVMRNVVLRGPDGVNFALYQQTTPPLEHTPSFSSTSMPFNGQQMVRNVRTTVDFYSSALGWNTWFDSAIRLNCNNFGMPANFVGEIPKKVAILHHKAERHGQMELVEWVGFDGDDFSAQSQPPNLGIMSLRIPVSDLETSVEMISQQGTTLFSNPSRVTIMPYGDVQHCSIMTPDGALLELFQPN